MSLNQPLLLSSAPMYTKCSSTSDLCIQKCSSQDCGRGHLPEALCLGGGLRRKIILRVFPAG
jgi:hypothetical protein